MEQRQQIERLKKQGSNPVDLFIHEKRHFLETNVDPANQLHKVSVDINVLSLNCY